MINHTLCLTVNGTSKSERAGGLDDGEVSTYTTKPGQYRKDFQTVDDLIANINTSAFMRGEWISSLKLDDHDLVEEYALRILRDNMLEIDAAAIELAQMGMFAAADLEDLIQLLQKIKSDALGIS